MNGIIETTQFHILTTHTCGKYVVHDTLPHCQSLKFFYKITNYGHRAQCLSPTQVAPGHVSEILTTMNTEGVKPENPELKK